MNTKKLKPFAQASRNKLRSMVEAKLEFVLHTDSADIRAKANLLEKLNKAIQQTSKEQVVEKVAYTWFNRLLALRYMDANGFNSIRVVSPIEGHTQPEILIEAKKGNVELEKVKVEKVMELLEGRVASNNPENDIYRMLLLGACEELNVVMPFMFEGEEDYAKLLMPDDLLSENSIVADFINEISDEDCQDVEIIGWLYQFYISERKDEVFADLKKNKKITAENIPPATQLFTPNWIVRYLVENSLGRLWLLNRPNSGLKAEMKYFVETEQEKEFIKISSPQEIKLLDPACGSGHILVYAFDLLTKIYEEEGFDKREIPKLILENNLFGIDIDDRAGALASFALMMKARAYSRRFLREPVAPKVISMQNVVFSDGEIDEYVKEVGDNLFTLGLRETLKQFEQAKNFGSLIKPEVWDVDNVKSVLAEKDFDGRMFSTVYETHQKVMQVLEMVEYLAPRYHCVVANPPYMGGKGMNPTLDEFVTKNYKKTRGDLFACFIKQSIELSKKMAFTSLISQQSWMFIPLYKDFRESIVADKHISSMLHLGIGVFKELNTKQVQSTAFTIHNHTSFTKGQYIRLVDEKTNEEKHATFLEKRKYITFNFDQKKYQNIFGSPIAYWISPAIQELFSRGSVKDFATTRLGMATADNNRFLRLWHEVSYRQFGDKVQSRDEALSSKKKWFSYQKGGDYRKWYGNHDYVVNWRNDGEEIRNFTDSKTGKIRSHNYNLDYIFKKGVTWSALSLKTSSRISENSIFDNSGSSLFSDDESNIYLVMGFLNSKIAEKIFPLISSTLNYQPGDIGKLPFSDKLQEKDGVVEAIKELIRLLKFDWDSVEISREFKCNYLVMNSSSLISTSTNEALKNLDSLTQDIKQLEEFVNHAFIKSYDMTDEFDEEVKIEDISAFSNREHLFSDFDDIHEKKKLHINYLIKDLLSYSVGCIFGRYSLDNEGLILSNQGDSLSDFFNAVPNVTFTPDEDNIIPILDDEFFIDDIVGRFKEFLKVSFGEDHYSENLKFIEDAIGKDIRKYFLKDFYDDHIKRYKKRPIYWMFSSPKGSFNALIYMHRYTPDLASKLLNDYLREFIEKLRSQINQHEKTAIREDISPAQKTKANKEVTRINKVLKELEEYEQKVIYPLALEKIEIDLDDGVLVNYNKFGSALKKVAGLSGKAKN